MVNVVLPSFVILWALIWAFLEHNNTGRLPGAGDPRAAKLGLGKNDKSLEGAPNTEVQHQVVELLRKLRKTRDRVEPRNEDGKIAIGFNVCLDAVVDALELLQRTGVKPVKGAVSPTISNLEDLGGVFTHHFERAAGGERSVDDRETFALLEEGLATCKSRRVLLGGNAAIMAEVLAKDWKFEHVSLGGPVGPQVEALLPDQIATFGLQPGEDVRGVEIKEDEVHIIMEFEKGSTWAGSKARRANRFIVSRDLSNAVLAALEPLVAHVRDAPDGPYDLLIAAGFHMLDAMDPEFRQERVGEIVDNFRSVPDETLIHFELAAVGEESLLEQLAKRIIPEVDSLGLNEQEMSALYATLGIDDIDLADVTGLVPKVESVTAIMSHVLSNNDRLGRIHFHSFGYHIIGQKKSKTDRWPNVESAVAAGSVKASERACAQTDLSAEDITLQLQEPFRFYGSPEVARISSESPVIVYETDDLVFALAPVLTCNKPVQTVGLGDSISASALAYQI